MNEESIDYTAWRKPDKQLHLLSAPWADLDTGERMNALRLSLAMGQDAALGHLATGGSSNNPVRRGMSCWPDGNARQDAYVIGWREERNKFNRAETGGKS